MNRIKRRGGGEVIWIEKDDFFEELRLGGAILERKEKKKGDTRRVGEVAIVGEVCCVMVATGSLSH